MVGASVLALILAQLLFPPLEKKQLITFAAIVIFGGMTIYFNNGLFIKWKPTVVNWIFAAILLIGQFVMQTNLIRKMFEAGSLHLNMPDRTWTKLNLAWAAFFIFLGALNLWVAFNFSEDFWITFKFTGMLGLNIAFMVAQGIILWPYLKKAMADAQSAESQPNKD